MTDGINKIPVLRDLIAACKNIVTKLHFNGDVVEQEMVETYNVEVVANLLAKIDSAFDIVPAAESTSASTKGTEHTRDLDTGISSKKLSSPAAGSHNLLKQCVGNDP
jgi:hypothetical protein